MLAKNGRVCSLCATLTSLWPGLSLEARAASPPRAGTDDEACAGTDPLRISMPNLVVRTVSGLPAFKLSVDATDSIGAVTKACAKRANIPKNICRLSLGVRGMHSILNVRDSVEGLGLKDGTVVLLHVKNTPLIKGLVRPAPLPVHSFASEGFGFFVNVVTPVGRHIFRPKITWTEDVGRVLEATRTRTSCKTATLKFKGLDGAKVKLEKGRKVSAYNMAANDELVVHGLPGERPPAPPRPLSSFGSSSFNVTAPDSPRSRPSSAGLVGAPPLEPRHRCRVFCHGRRRAQGRTADIAVLRPASRR